MSTVKVIKVNENVFAANDREADDIREMCKRNKTFFGKELPLQSA